MTKIYYIYYKILPYMKKNYYIYYITLPLYNKKYFKILSLTYKLIINSIIPISENNVLIQNE